MQRVRTVITTVCVAGLVALTSPATAGGPLAVGQPAPDIELHGADGQTHTLADLDGPAVLIFYRGLW